MNLRTGIVGSPLAGACLLLLGAGPSWSGQATDEAELRPGAQLYAENCASCHGANLGGQPDWQRPGDGGVLRAPPHDDSGHTWHHTDGLLIDYVTLGGDETLSRLGVTGVVSGMPAFGDMLSESEIRQVLDYIKTHWSERARAYQSELTRQDRDG